MALAAQSYDSTIGYMPPNILFIQNNTANGDEIGTNYFGLSFYENIMPFIEQSALYNSMCIEQSNGDGTTYILWSDGNNNAYSNPVKTYINPSDPSGNGTGLTTLGAALKHQYDTVRDSWISRKYFCDEQHLRV